jgi:hypothetical protein
MTDRQNNAPRRYFVDSHGDRVLIGLSLQETAEFESLDGDHGSGDGRDRIEDGVPSTPPRKTRWLDLYSKHDAAWKAWIAQSRAEQAASLTFVNHG